MTELNVMQGCPGVYTIPPEQAAAAACTVRNRAFSDEDAALILDILGLTPAADEQAGPA